MVRTANNKEEFEQIKKDYCDSSADWDNKNLMTDWLEEDAYLFDNNSISIKSNNKHYLGYIDGEPIEMEILKNNLHFRLFNATNQAKEKIRNRLFSTFRVFDENNNEYNKTEIIFVDRSADWDTFSLSFYWAKI